MVKVMILRKIKEGMEQEFWEMTAQLRANAVPRRGYVSGETWVDTNDPSRCVVISTWFSLEDWKAWEISLQRRAIAEGVDPLLDEPARTFVLKPPQGTEIRREATMPIA